MAGKGIAICLSISLQEEEEEELGLVHPEKEIGAPWEMREKRFGTKRVAGLRTANTRTDFYTTTFLTIIENLFLSKKGFRSRKKKYFEFATLVWRNLSRNDKAPRAK